MNTKNREWFKEKAWRAVKDPKGNLDIFQWKDCIVSLLFYRYLSEFFCYCMNKAAEHYVKDFDYAKFDFYKIHNTKEKVESFKNYWIKIYGFFLSPELLFKNVYAKSAQYEHVKNDLNYELLQILQKIENSGSKKGLNLKGLLITPGLNAAKEGKPIDASKLIWKIMGIIKSIEFNEKTSKSNDLQATDWKDCGDIYEYLIEKFNSFSGRKRIICSIDPKVSKLLAKIIIGKKTYLSRVYDPACRSGSLLLEFPKILTPINVVKIIGQDKYDSVCDLCRMNMIIHNIKYSKFEIYSGDTLVKPQGCYEPFEAIVSDLSHSSKWKIENKEILLRDQRFENLAGHPSSLLAFIYHCIYYLSQEGKAAFICPAAFLSDKRSKRIRQSLIDQNYIESIIFLPDKLFSVFDGYRTSRIILVISKKREDGEMLLIDGTKLIPEQEGAYSSFKGWTDREVDLILQVYQKWEILDSEKISSRSINKDQIENFKYDLSIKNFFGPESQYIGKEEEIKRLEALLTKSIDRQQNLREKIAEILRHVQEV